MLICLVNVPPPPLSFSKHLDSSFKHPLKRLTHTHTHTLWRRLRYTQTLSSPSLLLCHRCRPPARLCSETLFWFVLKFLGDCRSERRHSRPRWCRHCGRTTVWWMSAGEKKASCKLVKVFIWYLVDRNCTEMPTSWDVMESARLSRQKHSSPVKSEGLPATLSCFFFLYDCKKKISWSFQPFCFSRMSLEWMLLKSRDNIILLPVVLHLVPMLHWKRSVSPSLPVGPLTPPWSRSGPSNLSDFNVCYDFGFPQS